MSDLFEAIPAERGCGSRKEGGIYAELGLGPVGRPVEDFLIDPPVLVPDGLTIAARGVQLIERTGISGQSVWHILDWIGEGQSVRVGGMCDYCRAASVQRRHFGNGGIPKRVDFGSPSDAARINGNRQLENDVSVTSFDDKVGSGVLEDVSGTAHDVNNASLRAMSGRSGFGSEMRTEGQPLPKPVGEDGSSRADVDVRPVNSDESLAARLALPGKSDSPFAINDASDVSPLGRTKFGERCSGHAEIILPSHCTCKWKVNGYPNVADFIEEVRHLGLSRRLSRNLDFSKITEESRLITVHARAHIGNFADYRFWECPKGLSHHEPGASAVECCAGIWWQDVQGGEVYNPLHPREVRRQMPSFEYFAASRPDGVKPDYNPAFFASFPLTRLVVVKGEGADESAAKAGATSLPVDLVDR